MSFHWTKVEGLYEKLSFYVSFTACYYIILQTAAIYAKGGRHWWVFLLLHPYRILCLTDAEGGETQKTNKKSQQNPGRGEFSVMFLWEIHAEFTPSWPMDKADLVTLQKFLAVCPFLYINPCSPKPPPCSPSCPDLDGCAQTVSAGRGRELWKLGLCTKTVFWLLAKFPYNFSLPASSCLL